MQESPMGAILTSLFPIVSMGHLPGRRYYSGH